MSSLLPSTSSSTAASAKQGYATFDGGGPTAASTHSPPPTTHASASWASWLVFGYARALLDKSSETQRLELDDLWELEPEFRTHTAYGAYKRAFVASGGSATRAVARAFGKHFLICGMGSAIMAACSIFAPAVLHEVIDAFSKPELNSARLAPWIAAFFASRLIIAFTESHVNFKLETTLLRLTVSLKGLIFEKAMRRSVQSKNDKDVVDVSNLFTADIDNLMWAGYQINVIWITPIQVTVVVYMLYNVLGLAAFAGLGVIFVSMGLNYVVAKGYSDAYNAIMDSKDNRMKAVKEVFGAIQIVKLNAWESKFLERIREWRAKETSAIAKYLYLSAVSIFLFWSAPLFVSITSFATYALVLGKELTAAKVFTSMVLFNSIRDPLSQFPEALQAVLMARVALERMTKYLSTEEVDTSRISRDTENYAADVEVSIEDATFKWRAPPPKSEGSDSGSGSGSESEARETTPLKEATELKDDAASPRVTKTVLESVSLTVRKGDFVVVSGAVGSGKSSLCAALLGELPCEDGKVFVRSRSIAYYSQQPWIQNMTIRDNILFGLPFDQAKYDRVLDACGLVKDIAMFPAGDKTEIGQKGVNLSGGQKARVSLARACYADADVYVLDSPLAAVDAIVQSEIFNKCLCGLLEKKTVVLVTHLHDIIDSKAATVKVLLEGGKATVLYGERIKSRREYANLHTSAEDEEVSEEKDIVDGEKKGNPSASGILVEEEERETGRVSSAVFKAYFAAIGGWKVAVGYLLVLVGWQSFQVSSDLWLSHWTGSKPGTETTSSVAHNMTIYAVLGVCTGVFVLLRALVMAKVGVAAGRYLFDEMTKSLLNAPLRFFDANPIGRILNRYAEDVSTIDFHLPFNFFGMMVTTAVNVFQLATAIYVIKWAGLLILPLAYIYVQLGGFYLTTSREVSRLMKVTTSPVLSHLTQSEEGVAVLRSYGQAYVDRAIAESFRLNDASNRVWYAQASTSIWFSVRVQMIGFSIVVLVVSTLLTLHAYLSPGLVGLAFMYAVSIDLELAWWVKSWSWLELAMVSPERVLEYIGIEAEGHASDRLIVTTGPNNAEWPQRGAIAFDNVKFAYKPGGDLVLKGLSFEIHHNEKIGIVGRTGAGKSSLTMAIFRINELVSGRIMLDGVDISTVNLQLLRSHMSIIPQVPVLFKGPLRAYMDPFEEYDDASIWLAFEKVSLKEMVSALDGKLQHELSDNGENFSVGERQMLCMARALLRKSRVVLMDEATASIDRATEQKLQLMIQREFVDATVLTIAHRLSTVLESDRILVLSDGRVAEFDTPRELAKREGGVFRELAKEGGYLPQLLASA